MGKQVLARRFLDFLFPEESDMWLTILRLGLGIQVLLYCVSLRTDWNYLFASNADALISRDLTEAIIAVDSPMIPRLGWLVAGGAYLGINEQTILSLIWLALFCAACCLIAGIFCRTSAVTAWLLHLCAVKSGGLLSYGVDNFTTIGLFYLMVAPFPDRHSLDFELGRGSTKPAYLHGFHRRVLQTHMCFIYFFGGLAKCAGAGWWNGTSIWRALTRPPFNVLSPETLVLGRQVLPLVGISICLLETSYAFFIWGKRTRKIWLLAIIAMHLGIGLMMGLYLFSLVMIVLNLAAFAPNFPFTVPAFFQRLRVRPSMPRSG